MKGVIVATAVDQEPWLGARRGVQASPAARRPLIDDCIEAFVHAGFEELCVVVGHNGEILRKYLEDSSRYGIAVYCLYNPRHVWGSATSVCAARAFVQGEPFVVAVANRPLSVHSLAVLLEGHWTGHVLCMQRRGSVGSAGKRAMKVWLDPWGHVLQIGRNLDRWHGTSLGIYLFQPQVLDASRRGTQLSRARGSITALVRRMIADGEEVSAVDVAGPWRPMRLQRGPITHARPVLTVGLAREELVA